MKTTSKRLSSGLGSAGSLDVGILYKSSEFRITTMGMLELVLLPEAGLEITVTQPMRLDLTFSDRSENDSRSLPLSSMNSLAICFDNFSCFVET